MAGNPGNDRCVKQTEGILHPAEVSRRAFAALTQIHRGIQCPEAMQGDETISPSVGDAAIVMTRDGWRTVSAGDKRRRKTQ